MAETPSYNKRRNLQSKNDNSNNNGAEDRLTSLPETLLIEILSLIPLKTAAATSVLSHRWRHLWTHLTHLSFDKHNPPWIPSNADPPSSNLTFFRFKDIVHHILAQITSPHIQSFNLFIPDPGDTLDRHKLCTATLESLISFICTRNVAAIKVILDPFSESISNNVSVPGSIFQTQSLVQLHLDGWLYCTLPIITKGIASLPNLKKLQLGSYIRLDNLQNLWPFINSCPLLELLSLGFSISYDGVVNISLPMLKSLIINRIQKLGVEFVIDTPMLEHLSLQGCLGYYSFVKYPTKLIKAQVSIRGIKDRCTDEFGRILPLVQRISGVESVSLGNYMDFFNALNYLDVDVRSIFRNVTRLRLSSELFGCGFEVQNPIPLYLFSKLKILEIEMSPWKADYMKLLDHILRDANGLERLCVLSVYSVLDDIDDDEDSDGELYKRDVLWWEYKVYKTLLAVPKCSLPNEFEFVGIFIRASTDKSRNEWIVSIKD